MSLSFASAGGVSTGELFFDEDIAISVNVVYYRSTVNAVYQRKPIDTTHQRRPDQSFRRNHPSRSARGALPAYRGQIDRQRSGLRADCAGGANHAGARP